jgi:DNA recombination protein Rad52
MSGSGEYSPEEWLDIASNLQKQLGPEYLAQRAGPSGTKLTYIEGKTAINIANNIFGFNGWSTDIKDTTVDFVS